MFAYLKGTLEAIGELYVTVDVGGVGFKVAVSSYTRGNLPPMHQTVKLYTTFRVREDAMELFGFINEREQEIFDLLIGINGVGPKAAMSILSVVSPEQFPFVIAGGDTKAITQAAGVGPKLAQRIILELKDKVDFEQGRASVELSDLAPVIPNDEQSEAAQALVSLGYTYPEAAKAVRGVYAEGDSVEAVIKKALKQMM